MTESIDGYYLCAHCINAISYDSAEVEWIILSKDLNDNWVDRDGLRHYPFFIHPITMPHPPIPDGWIERLYTEADRHATQREPKINLAEALGIVRKPIKIDRRI